MHQSQLSIFFLRRPLRWLTEQKNPARYNEFGNFLPQKREGLLGSGLILGFTDLRYDNMPFWSRLLRGGHFVSGVLQSFAYARLAS